MDIIESRRSGRAEVEATDLVEDHDYKLTTKQTDADSQIDQLGVQLNLGEEMRNEIANLVMDEVEGAEENEERKEFIRHAAYCKKRYRMEDLDDIEISYPWKGCSKRRTGGTTIAINRLKPRIKRAIFYSGTIVGVDPGEYTTREQAEMHEQWQDAIMRDEQKLEERIDNVLYDALMLNFGVMKSPWRYTEEVRSQYVTYETLEELLTKHPDAIEKYPQYVERLSSKDMVETVKEVADSVRDAEGVLVKDIKDDLPEIKPLTVLEEWKDIETGVRPEWVDPTKIYLPKGVKDPSKSWLVIEETEYTRDDLLKKEACGFFTGVSEMFGEEDERGQLYKVYEAVLWYPYDKTPDSELKDKHTDDTLAKQAVYFVAESADSNSDNKKHRIMLRAIRYPFDHGKLYYQFFRTTDNRYGLYDGGLGRLLKSPCQSEDRRVNQIANAWDMKITPVYKRKYYAGAIYNPRLHKQFPGAILPVKEMDELDLLNQGDIPYSSMSLLQDNRNELETLSGISASLTGGQVTPGDPSAPAKKAELLMAESNVNAAEFLKVFVRGIKELAFHNQFAYYQYTTDKVLKYRTQNGMEQIPKSILQEKVAFNLKTTVESISAFEKARSNLQLVQVALQDPLFANDPMTRWIFWKTVVQNWSEEWADLTPEIENRVAMMIQQQQQAMQMQNALQNASALYSQLARRRGVGDKEIQEQLASLTPQELLAAVYGNNGQPQQPMEAEGEAVEEGAMQ